MAEATTTSVYQYYDSKGRILYVGVTARGIRRAHEHAESKDWWPHATGCSIEHYNTRGLALDRERQLIERHKPPFNTVHNDSKSKMRKAWESSSPEPKTFQRLPGPRVKTKDALKRACAEWYALPKSERLKQPCVNCGVNPSGPRFPQCATCHPSREGLPRVSH
jgi:hypothetical protein